MLFGASTLIVLVASWVPTLSLIVTIPGLSGAVHTNLVSWAPVVGVPSLAVHVPAAEPVKVTSSATPTTKRVLGPVGAAHVVDEVIVGAPPAAAGAAALSPDAPSPGVRWITARARPPPD